jgi:hypothetical protein
MEEVTGEDVPEDSVVEDVDIDAPVEGETKDAPPAAEEGQPATDEQPSEGAPAEESSEDDSEDDEDEDFKKKFSSIYQAMLTENPDYEDRARIKGLARRAARLSMEMGPTD